MATKLYLHREGVGTLPTGTLPSAEQSTLAPDANLFDNEDGSENRVMNTTISAQAQTTMTNTSTADTSAHNYYIGRWVSPALYQGSIDANTWTVEYGATESNAAANFPRSSTGAMYVNCYVWNKATGTKTGTILDGNSNADGEEAGTSQAVINYTFAGAAVTGIVPGDCVLVYELWAQVTQGNGTQRTQTVAYDGTTEGSTSNMAARLQTPENLQFSATAANMSTAVTGGSQATTANTTHYFPIAGNPAAITTTEDQVKLPIRQAGTLSKLGVRLSANGITSNSTFTLRKNGGDGSQVVTATASTAGWFEDLTNTDSVSAGDTVDVKFVPGAATNTVTLTNLNVCFTPTNADNTVQILAATAAANTTTASSTRYISINGHNTHTSTEANSNTRQRVSGTYQYFAVYVSANARTTDTVFKVRKNGSDTGVSVTYTSGQTGLKEDTSNSFTVAAGDDVTYAITTGTGTEQIDWTLVKIELTTAVWKGAMVVGNSGGGSVNANLTRNIIPGGNISFVTTENDTKRKIRHSNIIVTDLHAYIESNTVTANTTLKIRKNGANGNLSITIGSGVTGLVSDTSNVDSFGSNDDMNLQIITGATGTSMNFRSIVIYYHTGRLSLASILKYHILGRISQSRIYKYNILGRISLSRIYKWHLATRVSLERIYKYNIQSRVSLARSYLWNLIGRISQSRIYKWNLDARISLSRIYKWDVLARASLSRIYKWDIEEGLERVSLSRIYKWDLIGRISLSRIYKYHIQERISLSRIYKYHLLGRVSLERIYKWHLQSRVSLSRSYLYNIIGRVSLSRIYKYHVESRVSLARTYLYNIISRVSLSRIYKYNIQERVSLSRIYKWDLMARASLSRIYKYNIQSRVSLSRIYKWDLIGRISLAQTYLWHIIAGGLERISKPQIYKWDIVGRISLSRVYKYHVQARVSLSRLYKWNMLARVELSRIYKWHILERISLMRTYAWNLIERISLSRIYKHNIESRVSLSRTYLWNILVPGLDRVSKSQIYKWNILTRVSLNRIYKWSIVITETFRTGVITGKSEGRKEPAKFFETWRNHFYRDPTTIHKRPSRFRRG